MPSISYVIPHSTTCLGLRHLTLPFYHPLCSVTPKSLVGAFTTLLIFCSFQVFEEDFDNQFFKSFHLLNCVRRFSVKFFDLCC